MRHLRLGCPMAVELIKDTETKSTSTQSRCRIILSVYDSNVN